MDWIPRLGSAGKAVVWTPWIPGDEGLGIWTPGFEGGGGWDPES